MGLCFIIKNVKLCLSNYYIIILLMIKYFCRKYTFSGENFRYGYATVTGSQSSPNTAVTNLDNYSKDPNLDTYILDNMRYSLSGTFYLIKN